MSHVETASLLSSTVADVVVVCLIAGLRLKGKPNLY